MHQLPNRKPVSVWNYKPWWCQPWSIFLRGCLKSGLGSKKAHSV
ncbi:DUF6737 family protein [Scytonema millei]